MEGKCGAKNMGAVLFCMNLGLGVWFLSGGLINPAVIKHPRPPDTKHVPQFMRISQDIEGPQGPQTLNLKLHEEFCNIGGP